jgi:hypothetical protein
MKTITININNEKLADKVTWLLEHLKQDGLEIVSKEDLDDLKLLMETRKDKAVPFDEYLKKRKYLSVKARSKTSRKLTKI